MAAIIEIAIEGTLKTQIMYKANLSFTQLNEYLPLMLYAKLLTQAIYDCREGYVVTEKGLKFLKKHSELVNMIKTNGSVKKESIFLTDLIQQHCPFNSAQALKVTR